ncbi:MAG: DUF6089 family protein [Bacteroidales bacterium]|nr:DUF6089 family protein [Bacteroidales bacterium]
MKNRILLIVIILITSSFSSFGQARGDLALFIGQSYYLGDINHVTQFQNMGTSFGGFYRHNYNLRYSLRGNLYVSKLRASDSDSWLAFNRLRNQTFSMDILDAGLMAEFNFLPYITTSYKYRFAPYVTAGLGMMIPLSKSETKSTMTIPFGLGLKYNLGDKFSIGIEWVIRKTFSDELDGIVANTDNPLTVEFMTNQKAEAFRQTSTIYRNDYYVITGLFLSYKIVYKSMKCPAYNEAKTYE